MSALGEVRSLGVMPVAGLAARRVRVYLPRAYGRGGGARHPVLYAFDGQNVLDDEGSFAGGWRLHRAVEGLARTPRPREVPVLVAIDHGGPARIQELAPYAVRGAAGQLDALLDWLVGTLHPRVHGEFGITAGPVGAALVGSSMGGLAALYAHHRHPDVFGGALCLSPSLFMGGDRLRDFVASRPRPMISRIYLDAGEREARGQMARSVASLGHVLRARGYDDAHLMVVLDPHGRHAEPSWRRRMPRALRFMYR